MGAKNKRRRGAVELRVVDGVVLFNARRHVVGGYFQNLGGENWIKCQEQKES